MTSASNHYDVIVLGGVTYTDHRRRPSARPTLGSAQPRACLRSPTATCTHADAESNGFLTLLSNGERKALRSQIASAHAAADTALAPA